MLLLQGLGAVVAACPPQGLSSICLLCAAGTGYRHFSSAGWGDVLLSRFRGGLQSIQRDRYSIMTLLWPTLASRLSARIASQQQIGLFIYIDILPVVCL